LFENGNQSPPAQFTYLFFQDGQHHASGIIFQGFNQYEESKDYYMQNDMDLLSIKTDHDFILSAHNLVILHGDQQDSDLTTDDEHTYQGKYVDAIDILVSMVDAELNALSNSWSSPEPSNQCLLVEGLSVRSVEESLRCILINHNLRKRMYPALMEWTHIMHLFTVNPMISY
jgi:hypothetical protein